MSVSCSYTFKYKVDRSKPKQSPNTHEWFARQFAEQYQLAHHLQLILEFHDTPYKLHKNVAPEAAKTNAIQLIKLLDQHLNLFLQFYICDNVLPGKEQNHLSWFLTCIRDQDQIDLIERSESGARVV